MRILLIGSSSGRLDCIAEAVSRSRHAHLYILTNHAHVGLTRRGHVTCGPTTDPGFVAHWAELLMWGERTIAIISNEEPLATGVADALVAMGIPTVGPLQALARIETSKIYARDLCDRYLIAVNPLWGQFGPENDIADAMDWMHALGDFVIKPDGLTGGKGVRVMGDHFDTIDEAINYAVEIVGFGGRFIVEEKLVGEEFSLMSFVGGDMVDEEPVDMFPIQDHKRLLDGDKGPNTGGMGSYALTTVGATSLPFMTEDHLNYASRANALVVRALGLDNGKPFRGILYGNYIVTPKGVRLIEFNARMADPEILNALPLLETDFVTAANAIATGTLTPDMIRFRPQASVCKYLVPEGYPNAQPGGSIDLSGVADHPDLRIYRGGLDINRLTGSRAVAMVGFADTLEEAEAIAETACAQAQGPLFHRRDIGTASLIDARMERFDKVMNGQDSPQE